MGTTKNNIIWIRSEDAEHPKLERLRRAVEVKAGPSDGVAMPWAVWGTGLSRNWLMEKLEAGGQVLIMPPWMDGGFAGLPPARLVDAPGNSLSLDGASFMVSASNAITPSPAWREHGLFSDSRLAWLVAHEPFAGSGQAWLMTAELLVASPSTRPSEARALTAKVVEYLTGFCRKEKSVSPEKTSEEPLPQQEFTLTDIPYLLAAAGLSGEANPDKAAKFMSRRLGVEPDMGHVDRILTHPAVSAELTLPIGTRRQIAQAIDNLGGRSFRLEIEETCHE
jgi:hypothetical protein